MDRTCERCRYFRVKTQRDDAADVGECRLEKRMGVLRASTRACGAFAAQGEATAPPKRKAAPSRRGASQGVDPRPPEIDAATLALTLRALAPEDLKLALAAALVATAEVGQPLGRGFTGGTLTFVPTDEALKPKAMPLDQLLHKMVMIRDNLRVLEQKINTLPQLQDGERLDLHQHLLKAQRAILHMSSGWCPPPQAPSEGLGALLGLLDELAARALTLPPPPLADRWAGGEALFEAGALVIREPLPTFFFRLVRVRDALLTLEAHLSAHPHIAADEGGAMCAYLRRCYGTLTSFNVLFHERADYFTSQRG
ncbi:hypothetical protein KKF91_11525 [Myxococcota bacterium]|nr:hypothetical protein [Myxococcota bacterium]MBU1431158.1 hypothetical protein [Myxococcota bacterium]MBU1897489.1 hypothetical protein [Myxococcota bacterium]